MRASRLAPFLVAGLAPFAVAVSSASAACPNAVFRTGPSAKLPECRAYELVTPTDTEGHDPNFLSILADVHGMFATDTVTPSGDSVVYETIGGALSGYPGTGYVDRYRARRTAEGWRTGAISPGGVQSAGGGPGGISADHEYAVEQAIDPTDELWPGLSGQLATNVIRTPSGYEPVGLGSLGLADAAEAQWVSAGGTHIIFTTTAMERLEPEATTYGKTIYDRSPGKPTHVVSLQPNGEAVEQSVFLGATKDGSEVAFGPEGQGRDPIYVRRNDTTTEEVVRPGGVVVGKELQCSGGPGNASLTYQWLGDGSPIGGATSPTYTTQAADEGAVVQCRVTASNSEGTSIATSQTWFVEPYQDKAMPDIGSAVVALSAGGNELSSVAAGSPLYCRAGGEDASSFTVGYQWLSEGSPIVGATSSTYTPLETEVGQALQCRVTVSDSAGTSVGYSRPVSIYTAVPRASANPTVSDVTAPGDTTPAVGDELSCAEGTWSASPSFAYQWLRNGAPIGSATVSTYTVSVAEEGKAIQCRVTATTSGGTTVAVSDRVVAEPQPATAPPQQTQVGVIWGSGEVGESLSCETGKWSGSPTFSRQWLRNGAEIAGATSSTYTPTAAELEAVIQCRLTATNAGGATVAIDASEGAKVIVRPVPQARAKLPTPGFTFGGIFNGRVFYSDGYTTQGGEWTANPGDLYMYDLNEEKTTRITDTGDAIIVNVSEDGSHVYFVSRSLIGGEGEAGKPNLGVYSVATKSSKFIATLAERDVAREAAGFNQYPSLAAWSKSFTGSSFDDGRAMVHDRSTPDGKVFAFESTARLSAFDNTEASAETCGAPEYGSPNPAGEGCDEVYRYDAVSGELTCVSCGPGPGPATGNARLASVSHSGGLGDPEVEPANVNVPVESLTEDGNTIFFESTEALVPQDGNGTKDVYRWKKGAGLALISTGQDPGESALYAVTPNGSDVIFGTREKLLPQDANGTTVRLYDARVEGGFPPPEETVTEPCSGDTCQGASSAAPEAPQVASESIEGGGNVAPKLHCRRGRHRVIRRGNERCVKPHHHHHRRAGAKRRAGQ